ncbi:hypothetical protein C8R43DRAFT_1129846 [Mycena crocata]|nr:hypothetical protein C8R43DRAFT_1129846 [Mycena crocata]
MKSSERPQPSLVKSLPPTSLSAASNVAGPSSMGSLKSFSPSAVYPSVSSTSAPPASSAVAPPLTSSSQVHSPPVSSVAVPLLRLLLSAVVPVASPAKVYSPPGSSVAAGMPVPVSSASKAPYP